MKFPKLMIASDGRHSAVLLDGVFFGPGIGKIKFSSNGSYSRVKLLDIDVARFSVNNGETQFLNFIESTSK